MAIHVAHEGQKDRFVSFVEGLFYHYSILVFDDGGSYVWDWNYIVKQEWRVGKG